MNKDTIASIVSLTGLTLCGASAPFTTGGYKIFAMIVGISSPLLCYFYGRIDGKRVFTVRVK